MGPTDRSEFFRSTNHKMRGSEDHFVHWICTICTSENRAMSKHGSHYLIAIHRERSFFWFYFRLLNSLLFSRGENCSAFMPFHANELITLENEILRPTNGGPSNGGAPSTMTGIVVHWLCVTWANLRKFDKRSMVLRANMAGIFSALQCGSRIQKLGILLLNILERTAILCIRRRPLARV